MCQFNDIPAGEDRTNAHRTSTVIYHQDFHRRVACDGLSTCESARADKTSLGGFLAMKAQHTYAVLIHLKVQYKAPSGHNRPPRALCRNGVKVT